MSSSVSEIGELLKGVSFEDNSEKVAATLCAIIVKGKPAGYCFESYFSESDDPIIMRGYAASSRFDAVRRIEKELGIDGIYIRMDKLTETLLERSGLVKFSGAMPDGIFIEPTQKALAIYERLKAEGRLDSNGFLDGNDCGFC